jgi:hypothetical protein
MAGFQHGTPDPGAHPSTKPSLACRLIAASSKLRGHTTSSLNSLPNVLLVAMNYLRFHHHT